MIPKPAPPPGYSTTARLLHWAVALIVLLMIPAGLLMVRNEVPIAIRNNLFLFHKNFGVILFCLVVVRVVYVWRNPPPPLPDTVLPWQKRAAALSHLGLYGLLLVLPMSGFARVRLGGFPIEMLDALGVGPWLPRSDALAELAKLAHFAFGLAIIGLLALHLGAAAQHAVRRDGIISRMWPPFSRR